MKITEECINHNIVRAIKDIDLSELGTADVSSNECKYWLGYIDGLVTLGEYLKEATQK